MIALIFFQITAVAIILGAELNRGLIVFKEIRNYDDDGVPDKHSVA